MEGAEHTFEFKSGNQEFEENVKLPCPAPPPPIEHQKVTDAPEVFSFCGGRRESVNVDELEEKSRNKEPDLVNT